ncbi:hypothetical protein Scep_011952 [Stephania cephalantha]|uniref:Uncharacterized protein n=1 Tax=Stephania cephalantha TaxID=152367 RepID=A0AAP0JEB8_9MAGN
MRVRSNQFGNRFIMRWVHRGPYKSLSFGLAILTTSPIVDNVKDPKGSSDRVDWFCHGDGRMGYVVWNYGCDKRGELETRDRSRFAKGLSRLVKIEGEMVIMLVRGICMDVWKNSIGGEGG